MELKLKKEKFHYSKVNCVNFYDINDILCDIEFVKKGRKGKISNVASVFDIEATSFYNKDNEKQCTMYAWVFGINGKCIRGRTWEEFINILNVLIDKYELSIQKRFVIYIHNLGYEFQWFRKYFDWENVFSLDDRRPIYAITKQGIEFRCSYILSGYSLEILGKNLLKYKVQKKVGDLDYKLIRHSKTPITEKEWGYILNDGLVVMSYIQEEIERLGDITKIPLTKTGYVRELCRENCFKSDNRFSFTKLMRSLKLTVDDYKQLKRTYSGGFTHANVNYVNKIVKNVSSYDFTSSYPAVMIAEKYPMSKPYYTEIKNEKDFFYHLKTFCCMFDITFYDIRSISSFENYISSSRCFEKECYILNNGRIVEASKISLSITEQDFFIISKLYEWEDIEIYNFKYFFKDYLPKDFILSILDLYSKKTTLKGVEGKEVEYMVSKNMINSCYGMAVTDPCRDEIVYNENMWQTKKGDLDTLIDKYNRNNNRFLYYPWGVWVTAYARSNLFSGILEFKDDYIYSDTDSIKVLNKEKHTMYINEYNKNVTDKIKKCLDYYNIPYELANPKTKNGIAKPLGVWEYEGTYTRFKTLGAKRYITENDNELSITIAGVGKKAGLKYLKHKYKNNDEIFKNFTEKLLFLATYICDGVEENGSGKQCHTYIDVAMYGEVIDYMGNVGYYNEKSGVHLENTEYELNLDEEFKKLLLGIKGGHIC